MGYIIFGIIILIIILFIAGVWLDLYAGIKIQHPKLPVGLYKTSHNQLETFQDGIHFFSALEKDITMATRHIHLSFYIFREDRLGTNMFQLLEKKAAEGVNVRILMDAIGTRKLRRKLKNRLSEAGVEWGHAQKPRFPFFFYNVSRRYHRKISIIDGQTGYFGGFNVGDEYMGRDPKYGDWRDYHVKIKGGGVHFLQEQFLSDWHEATRQTVSSDDLFAPDSPTSGTVKLTLLATYGKQLEQVFIDHISQAKHRLIIGSPYFIPSARLQAALLNRLESDVSVTVILPGRKDHPFVRPASYHYLKPLVEKGLKLYHFHEGFYHAKTFIIDEDTAYLGTANFDRRSLFWNDELSGFIYDANTVRHLTENIEIDLYSNSSEVTAEMIENRSAVEKAKTFLSCLLAPLL